LRDLLFKDSAKNKSFVVSRARRGVKEAILDYRCLKTASVEGDAVTLISVRLHTGRTHQIRVQFSSRRHPLLGDAKYGGNADYPLALHAYRLSFVHPNGKRLTFSSEQPAELPWILFEET
jgi:23S rRNA pseudouridine1911/1915/1917 synthase